jgi:hypothetical protein
MIRFNWLNTESNGTHFISLESVKREAQLHRTLLLGVHVADNNSRERFITFLETKNQSCAEVILSEG